MPQKNIFQRCLNFLSTTLHKVTEKTLCHVVQEAPLRIYLLRLIFNYNLALIRLQIL